MEYCRLLSRCVEASPAVRVDGDGEGGRRATADPSLGLFRLAVLPRRLQDYSVRSLTNDALPFLSSSLWLVEISEAVEGSCSAAVSVERGRLVGLQGV
jgi:hypothetical protein